MESCRLDYDYFYSTVLYGLLILKEYLMTEKEEIEILTKRLREIRKIVDGYEQEDKIGYYIILWRMPYDSKPKQLNLFDDEPLNNIEAL